VRTKELVKIREGRTDLMVPAEFCTKGPGKATGDVFYNRQMEFSRDVSVMLGPIVLEKGARAIDGLAASGARGLRMANECGSGALFFLNDRSESAHELIRANADMNGLCDVTAFCAELRALLAESRYAYIDVDPFGTPIDFIDAAVQSCGNGGVLAITATDTAPLAGTYPKTCLRRYGARSMRGPFSHETALRILIGYIVREAAKHDRGAEPMLCFHADHYYRCHMRMRNGARRADDALGKMGYAVFDRKTLRRGLVSEAPRADTVFAGPLWTGPLHSKRIVESLTPPEWLGTRRRCERMVDLWRQEVEAPGLFFDVDELAQSSKCQPPRLTRLIEELREHGAAASSTHLSPKGVKTDLDAEELLRLFADISRR
jgi:tRNA (guanine26-N2/guanine27-N2)-dimethyltransferase